MKVRCFGFLLDIQLFFHVEQKNIEYALYPLKKSQTFPKTFLELLKLLHFFCHFPDFLAKFLKCLTIPDSPDIPGKMATLVV